MSANPAPNDTTTRHNFNSNTFSGAVGEGGNRLPSALRLPEFLDQKILSQKNSGAKHYFYQKQNLAKFFFIAKLSQAPAPAS